MFAMNKPRVSIISAIAAANRAIGKGNKLLWHIPEDLQRFKKITSGHPVIMGRKTYESIGRPLPGRLNIIVTRDPAYVAQGCVIVHSLDDAITRAAQEEGGEIFVIGGAQLYAQALPLADTLYLTLVEGAFDADAFFPAYAHLFRTEIFREAHRDDQHSYTFVTLQR